MPEMGNALATTGSADADRGQFHWRRWSVAVANVGRWLAFCSQEADPCPELAGALIDRVDGHGACTSILGDFHCLDQRVLQQGDGDVFAVPAAINRNLAEQRTRNGIRCRMAAQLSQHVFVLDGRQREAVVPMTSRPRMTTMAFV